jgi:hypothetical protein
MATPSLSAQGTSGPALAAPSTAQAIRDALIEVERTEFGQRFADEMAQAARTLDLTGVRQVLDVYRKIAGITQRQGAEVHRPMLDQAARLHRGESIPTIPGTATRRGWTRGWATDRVYS